MYKITNSSYKTRLPVSRGENVVGFWLPINGEGVYIACPSSRLNRETMAAWVNSPQTYIAQSFYF